MKTMKKMISLWKSVHNIQIILLQLILFLIVFTISVYLLEPKYFTLLQNTIQGNVYIIYFVLGTIMLLTFFLFLSKNIWDELIRNSLMAYWLALTRKEYCIFLLLNMMYHYYIFLIVMTVFLKRSIQNTGILFGALSTVYFIMFTYIFMIEYNKFVFCPAKLGKKNKEFKNAGLRLKIIDGHPGFSPIFQLVLTGIKYRYKSIESILIKVVILLLATLLMVFKVDKKYSFLFFFLYLISTFTEDNYWKKEMKTIFFIKNSGTSFLKVFIINLLSGVLFHGVELSLFYILLKKDFSMFCLFLIVQIMCLWYWTIAYFYMYFLGIHKKEILKNLYLFIILLICFIPGVNILVAIYLTRKSNSLWREEICWK